MKTFPKRLVAIWAVLTMLTGCISMAFAEEDENIFEFEPKFLNSMDMTSSKWYSTKDSRELLVATIIAGFSMEAPTIEKAHKSFSFDEFKDTIVEAIVEDAVYVGQMEDSILNVFFFGNNALMHILYVPTAGVASGFITDMDNASKLSTFILASMTSQYPIEYEHVDGNNIRTLITSLASDESK